MILQRPGIGLDGALRVGVAAEMQEIAADRVVADQRYQRLERGRIEHLSREAVVRRIGDRPAVMRELLIVERHPHTAAPIFRRITE